MSKTILSINFSLPQGWHELSDIYFNSFLGGVTKETTVGF